MGIFSKISHAIFGTKAEAAEAPAAAAPVETVAATSTPAETPASATAEAPTIAVATTVAAAEAPAIAQAPAAPAALVDVVAIMDAAVAATGQKLDWRHSIVDMMKALGMESTLAERKELAAELHYAGDTHDSAAMNIWLHKALMQKLADNGGHVPADLLK